MASIAATGILPLSGYWSKDAILGNALFSHNPAWHEVGPIAWGIGTLAALGTAFYMTRLYWLTFQGAPRTHQAEHAHESSPAMTVPLMVLAVLATVALILGLPGHTVVSEVYQHFVSPVFAAGTERLLAVGHFHEGAHPAWPFFFAWGIAAVGTAIAVAMYGGGLTALPGKLAKAWPWTYRFMNDKFRVDELYEFLVIKPLKASALALWKVIDVFLIDGVFVNGVPRAVALGGRVVRLAQNGDVQRYAAIMAVAAGAILWTVLGTGGR